MQPFTFFFSFLLLFVHRASGSFGVVSSHRQDEIHGDNSRAGNTLLHDAAESGNIGIIDELLLHLNVNTLDDYGLTPLDWAMTNSHNHEMVTALLDRGAVLTIAISAHKTLFYAARKGNSSIIAHLIRHGANPNGVDHHGKTPLYYATIAGHRCAVEALLIGGADPNTVSSSGDAYLHIAAGMGFTDIAATLLAKGAHVNAQTLDGKTSLHIASAAGHFKMVDLLLQNDAKVDILDSAGHDPLFYAQNAQHSVVVCLLCSAMPNTSNIDASLYEEGIVKTLSYAVDQEDVDGIKIIMRACKSKFDIDSLNERHAPLLYCPIMCGNVEIVEILLSNGANPVHGNGWSHTLLEYAAIAGNVQIFDLMLQKCLERNVEYKYMYSALERAVYNGHIAIVKSLLATCISLVDVNV